MDWYCRRLITECSKITIALLSEEARICRSWKSCSKLSNGTVRSTVMQTVQFGGFLWLNLMATSVEVHNWLSDWVDKCIAQ